ncbi:MAG: phytanoyl-CoA dioxygenase family protein [Planctomycetes bacterium]|nr:phytanoyl-CoA dioxygenase family protein [Planctomycetota bacterium]
MLDEKGYVVLHGMMGDKWLEALRTTYEKLMYEKYGKWREDMKGFSDTDFWNHEAGTRRLADLVSEGEAFDDIYAHPRLLAAIAHVLGTEFKLHSLNARDALPGQGQQALHIDAAPRKEHEPYSLVNTAWILDGFTAENGATRVVPGSHKMAGELAQYVIDPAAPHPQEELVIAPAGSVLVFNAHLWHSGTMNRSRRPRRVIHCAFCTAHAQQRDRQIDRIRKSTYDRISPAARIILDV